MRHLAREIKKKTRNVSIAAIGLVVTSASIRDGVIDNRSSDGRFMYKYPKKVQRFPKGAAVRTMDVVYSTKMFYLFTVYFFKVSGSKHIGGYVP